MEEAPKISIVTPSFNQGAFIERTILSVLEQGYPNLEHIIIDGGSTDKTVEVIKKYEKNISYWVSEKDNGQANAINKGFHKATGELLGWLNSDDRLEPGALHTVAEHSRRFPRAGVFVGHGRIVDIAGEEISYTKPGDLHFDGLCRWLAGGNFMQPSCFFRREAFLAAGPLDESIYMAFDLDLWLRLAKIVDFQHVDKLLSTALSHEKAKTTEFPYHMVVDCAVVIIRAGGAEAAQERLNQMASLLSFYEDTINRLKSHPVLRQAIPIARYFMKKRPGIEDFPPKR
jgi:glycosyltransferase involved in cell wall biosynthesis